MSTTITLTVPVQNRVILKMRAAEQTVEQQVQKLIKEMVASSLFSEASLARMKVWEGETQELFAKNIQEKREESSLALCYLLFEVIYPEVKNYQEAMEKQEKLLDFEDDLKRTLAHTLPNEESVEDFCDAYQLMSEEEDSVREKEFKASECFQEQLRGIQQEVDKKLQDAFETVKKTLRSVNENRTTMAKEMCGKIELLMEKIEKASIVLERTTSTAKSIGERMQMRQQMLSRLIQESQQLLQNINHKT